MCPMLVGSCRLAKMEGALLEEGMQPEALPGGFTHTTAECALYR